MTSDKPIVLIVDDSPEIIQTLALCLKDDYHIKVATNGYRCLELSTGSEPPDLILLDVMMPEMNGYEVLKLLKVNNVSTEIPVIFVTGNDTDRDEEEGLVLGAVDYIVKPISPMVVKARVRTHVTLKKQRDDLVYAAMYDQLTGIYNRHFLVESAQQKVAFAQRHKKHLSILLIDIDHFKQVNDNYGHAEGDRVLKAVAAELQDHCRKEDIVARFGGEEFVVLLDGCDVHSAATIAEKLKGDIAAKKVNGHSVTASIGVAQYQQDGESLDALLNRADKALYRAKSEGRNRVEIAQDNF